MESLLLDLTSAERNLTALLNFDHEKACRLIQIWSRENLVLGLTSVEEKLTAQ